MTTHLDPTSDEFRNLVFESNDRAVENGFDLFEWAPEEIAVDLGDYDVDFEGIEPEVLVPHIVAWFEHHGRTPPEADPRIVEGHDH